MSGLQHCAYLPPTLLHNMNGEESPLIYRNDSFLIVQLLIKVSVEKKELPRVRIHW